LIGFGVGSSPRIWAFCWGVRTGVFAFILGSLVYRYCYEWRD
jgi:hypothetical protein